MKKNSNDIRIPDTRHQSHDEGRHVGGHDEHVHGMGEASQHGMKNMKGHTTDCTAHEKFYAHMQ